MPRGISLHVGVNRASSAFPSAATLRGCENDARAMEQIARDADFTTRDVLLGADATYARVITKIRSAAAQLGRGDFFFFSFAGHGFQRVDTVDDRDEPDHLDETILLFDVELFDDVLRKDLWPRFEAGVRILMVSDSCHSGSVFLEPGDPPTLNIEAVATLEEDLNFTTEVELPVLTGDKLVARTVSHTTARRHRAEYNTFYQSTLLPFIDPPIRASVLLLGACEDFDRTGDDLPNGVYTAALLYVLNNLKPIDYDDLVNKIHQRLIERGRTQRPVIVPAGSDEINFRGQRPFTIN